MSLAELISKGAVGVGELEFHGAGARLDVVRVDVKASDLGDNSEVDTGVDLPDNCVVFYAWIEVITGESSATTKTLDVGLLSSETAGDADGFLNGVDVENAGIVQGTLASGGQTLGALLSVDEDGAGALVPEPHVIDGNAQSVSVTFGDAAGATELDAKIYFLVVRLV